MSITPDKVRCKGNSPIINHEVVELNWTQNFVGVIIERDAKAQSNSHFVISYAFFPCPTDVSQAGYFGEIIKKEGNILLLPSGIIYGELKKIPIYQPAFSHPACHFLLQPFPGES